MTTTPTPTPTTTDHTPTVRGRRVELGHYTTDTGEPRVLVGQRIDGIVHVYDQPTTGDAPTYLVERGVGLRVVHELMEAEVSEIVGPKGKHDRERTASRHGHEDGSMTLGGRGVPVSRPRARSVDGTELPVARYR